MIKNKIFPILEWQCWSRLGWYDILSRYRRTILGPFWIVLLTLVNIAAIGLVYGTLFKIHLGNFIPYMAIGLITWIWISSSLIEAASAFTSYKFVLINYKIHLTSIIIRVLVRNLIIFLHNCTVILLIVLFFGLSISPVMFIVLPAVFLTTGIIYVLSIPIAFICTRFRDLNQIIIVLINLGFLITPVIWFSDILLEHKYIVIYNPFAHILDLVRLPILGSIPPTNSWLVSIVFFVFFAFLSFFCIRRYSRDVNFWL